MRIYRVCAALVVVASLAPARGAFSDTPANRLKAVDPATSPTVHTLAVLGGNMKAHWTINTVEKHVEAMEMPKKFRIAKKKAELAEKKAKLAEEKAAREAIEAAGGKAPKKARANKFAYP